MNHISINRCQNVDLSNLRIIAPQDSPNTDGIDVSSSTNVHIHHSQIETGACVMLLFSLFSFFLLAFSSCNFNLPEQLEKQVMIVLQLMMDRHLSTLIMWYAGLDMA